METKDILDSGFIPAQKVKTQSVSQFSILSVATFGLYEVWWFYKTWRYFKEKENLDIQPVWRALFAIFFVHSLAQKIHHNALSIGYDKDFSPGTLATVYILLAIIPNFLPDPLWLIGILAFVPLIPLVSGLRHCMIQAYAGNAMEDSGYSGRQIFLLVAGVVFWILVFVGLLAPDGESGGFEF